MIIMILLICVVVQLWNLTLCIAQVVCEELDWLPFYPGNFGTQKQLHSHKSKRDGPPNAEAIPQVIDVCSHWMQSFIKYSEWLENPSNIKAAKFLSRG